MKKITDEQVNEIKEALEGTCDTLDGAIQEFTGDDSLSSNDLTSEQHSEIEQEIFLCDDCGWWYAISDQSETEAGYCENCAPEEEELSFDDDEENF
jgi:hypothetical protein